MQTRMQLAQLATAPVRTATARELALLRTGANITCRWGGCPANAARIVRSERL